MTISRYELEQWTKKAHSILQNAKELCSTAETLLQLIQNEWNKTVDNFNRITEELSIIKSLHSLIQNYIDFMKNKIEMDILTQYDKKYGRLKHTMKEFDDILKELEYTSVPKILIDPDYLGEMDNDDDQLLLKSFISMEEIDLLTANIEIYNNNMKKLHNFMNGSLKETIITPFNQVLMKKYSKLISKYDEIYLQYNQKVNTINTIIKENTSLEQELVKLLQMLTNHYDQCELGLKSYDPQNEQDYEILRNDSMEVEEVIKDVKSMYDIIINNEIRSKKILQILDPNLDRLINQINELMNLYNKFKSTNLFQLIIFLLKYHELLMMSSTKSLNNPLDNYLHIFTQLINHYKHFSSIFKTKYLIELHHQQFTYPRKFLHKLNHFLNNELYNFQHDELLRRQHWLSKYGEFIPKQFKLPGDNQPSIVQVVTEGLENYDNPDDEVYQEKQLLDLIKSFM